MGSLVRYLPSAIYTRLTVASAGIAIACVFLSRIWLPLLASLLSVLLCFRSRFFAFTRPPIEVHDSHLQVGRQWILWETVSHIDEPRSVVPLVLPPR